jgi:hypothetical protein
MITSDIFLTFRQFLLDALDHHRGVFAAELSENYPFTAFRRPFRPGQLPFGFCLRTFPQDLRLVSEGCSWLSQPSLSLYLSARETFLLLCPLCFASWIFSPNSIDLWVPLRASNREPIYARRTPIKYKTKAMTTTVPTIPRPPLEPHLEYP